MFGQPAGWAGQSFKSLRPYFGLSKPRGNGDEQCKIQRAKVWRPPPIANGRGRLSFYFSLLHFELPKPGGREPKGATLRCIADRRLPIADRSGAPTRVTLSLISDWRSAIGLGWPVRGAETPGNGRAGRSLLALSLPPFAGREAGEGEAERQWRQRQWSRDVGVVAHAAGAGEESRRSMGRFYNSRAFLPWPPFEDGGQRAERRHAPLDFRSQISDGRRGGSGVRGSAAGCRLQRGRAREESGDG